MPDLNDPASWSSPEWNPLVQRYVPIALGDGLSGSLVTYTVNTSLTADVRAGTIVIYPGVTLLTQGFELVAQDLILNNGTVSANGGDATGVGIGAGGGGNAVLSTAGINGGSGGVRTGGGGAPQTKAGESLTAEAFANIGNGGNGGSGGGVGGISGGFTLDTSTRSPMMGPDIGRIYGYAIDVSGSFTYYLILCGNGGGGGNAAVGGFGGGGAGINRLRARRIINNGLVTASGGNGSDATGVNGSGGGGGGGGRNIVSGFRYGNGRYLVTGGKGGAKDGTGTVGLPGLDGRNHFFE